MTTAIIYRCKQPLRKQFHACFSKQQQYLPQPRPMTFLAFGKAYSTRQRFLSVQYTSNATQGLVTPVIDLSLLHHAWHVGSAGYKAHSWIRLLMTRLSQPSAQDHIALWVRQATTGEDFSPIPASFLNSLWPQPGMSLATGSYYLFLVGNQQQVNYLYWSRASSRVPWRTTDRVNLHKQWGLYLLA